jgi:hypothetical protein
MRFGFPCGWSMLTTFGNFALASTIAAGRNACGHWTLAQLEVDDAALSFRYRRHSTDSYDSCLSFSGLRGLSVTLIAQKNPCTERCWCFQCREVWRLTRARSNGLVASCLVNKRQFRRITPRSALGSPQLVLPVGIRDQRPRVSHQRSTHKPV